MGITVISPPEPSAPCSSASQALPPDKVGRYSVGDECFLWSTARELELRCRRHDSAIPPQIVSLLQLKENAQDARSMVGSLLAIGDLEKRRGVVCAMVHAIVRLNGTAESH